MCKPTNLQVLDLESLDDYSRCVKIDEGYMSVSSSNEYTVRIYSDSFDKSLYEGSGLFQVNKDMYGDLYIFTGDIVILLAFDSGYGITRMPKYISPSGKSYDSIMLHIEQKDF